MEASERTKPSYQQWAARLVLALIAVLALLVLWDSLGTKKSDLRQFDPIAMARLETKMWRSYYEKRQGAVLLEMIQLLRTQYHLSIANSVVASVHATRAAFVFKAGHNRMEYQQALSALVSFYQCIRETSSNPFDVKTVAKNELEWWIQHREVTPIAPEPLVIALAELQASIYQVPVKRLMDHAQARADAMLLRDRWGDRGQMSEEQWNKIRELLEHSWASLHNSLRDVAQEVDLKPIEPLPRSDIAGEQGTKHR